MKKISLLLAVFFVLFAFSACEEDKDDQVEPEKKITVENLKGDWDFVSLEFEGETYTGCDPELNRDYAYVTLNFYDVTESEMMLYTECVDIDHDPDDRVYPYTLKDDVINCYDGSRVFKIINYDSFDGTKLKVKLIDAKTTSIPIGGIYTLEKQ